MYERAERAIANCLYRVFIDLIKCDVMLRSGCLLLLRPDNRIFTITITRNVTIETIGTFILFQEI